jgi:hypothetical protein
MPAVSLYQLASFLALSSRVTMVLNSSPLCSMLGTLSRYDLAPAVAWLADAVRRRCARILLAVPALLYRGCRHTKPSQIGTHGVHAPLGKRQIVTRCRRGGI